MFSFLEYFFVIVIIDCYEQHDCFIVLHLYTVSVSLIPFKRSNISNKKMLDIKILRWCVLYLKSRFFVVEPFFKIRSPPPFRFPAAVSNPKRPKTVQVVETLSHAGADMTARNAQGLQIHETLGERSSEVNGLEWFLSWFGVVFVGWFLLVSSGFVGWFLFWFVVVFCWFLVVLLVSIEGAGG